jgi:protein-disulfide isomerase
MSGAATDLIRYLQDRAPCSEVHTRIVSNSNESSASARLSSPDQSLKEWSNEGSDTLPMGQEVVMNRTDQSAPLPVARPRVSSDVVSTVAILATCAVMTWKFLSPSGPPLRLPPTLQPPPEVLSLNGASLRGNSEAKVVLIEYSDFECSFCASFARNTLPEIKAEYVDTGRIQIAFRHFPLENHALAGKAAEAALCAGSQGRFWEMHDLLFSVDRGLGETALFRRASDLNLSLPPFEACLKGAMSDRVREDRSQALAVGVASTPSFFIGAVLAPGEVKVHKAIVGAKPLQEFRSALDSVLAAVD